MCIHKKANIQLYNLGKMLRIKKEYGLLKYDNELEKRIEILKEKCNFLYDLSVEKARDMNISYKIDHMYYIPYIVLK
jgi:hypothetical protein